MTTRMFDVAANRTNVKKKETKFLFNLMRKNWCEAFTTSSVSVALKSTQYTEIYSLTVSSERAYIKEHTHCYQKGHALIYVMTHVVHLAITLSLLTIIKPHNKASFLLFFFHFFYFFINAMCT